MLHDALQELNRYAFHMPGHKRNPAFGITGSSIDITEIEGFDNLHQPQGYLREIEEDLAQLYHAARSFISVGGSTLGILCAICAVCREGDTVLVARNCHKSVYNACFLKKIKMVFIEPAFDACTGTYMMLSQNALNEAAKQHPEAKAVIITSPTYEGYVTQVKTDLPLIVDAAHGAHFGFGSFPPYPQGSIVISSLHKTLPALTQTAVIHVFDPQYEQAVKFWLDILQTTSPSYVLMNSISVCCRVLKEQGMLFDRLYRDLESLRKLDLRHLVLKENDDISKIVISTERTTLTGTQLAALLRASGIEPEMAAPKHIVLLCSIGDETPALEHLKQVLETIDKSAREAPLSHFEQPPAIMEPVQIQITKSTASKPLNECLGAVANEFVYAYPPDIPLLLPGTVIDAAIINYLTQCFNSGIQVISDSGTFPNIRLTNKN